jgi:hypothetical protein
VTTLILPCKFLDVLKVLWRIASILSGFTLVPHTLTMKQNNFSEGMPNTHFLVLSFILYGRKLLKTRIYESRSFFVFYGGGVHVTSSTLQHLIRYAENYQNYLYDGAI